MNTTEQGFLNYSVEHNSNSQIPLSQIKSINNSNYEFWTNIATNQKKNREKNQIHTHYRYLKTSGIMWETLQNTKKQRENQMNEREWGLRGRNFEESYSDRQIGERENQIGKEWESS